MSYTETLPEHSGTWTASDAWASEREVAEFLYGLVRVLKPAVIIETGCYHGDTAKLIANAIIVNDFGHLYSCDINPAMIVAASMECAFGENSPVTFALCTGEVLCSDIGIVDLAFLDSSGDRVAEALSLKLSPRGIVVLHDARRDTLKEIVEKTGWQQIFIDTPRGCAILQPKRVP